MRHETATDLARLMQCEGSYLLERPSIVQDDDTTLRDEGNAWHWLAQQLFDGRLSRQQALGATAYNGVFITAPMIQHAVDYIDALWAGEMEQRTSFQGNGWQIDARADHVAFDAATSTLYVDDGKYGYGLVSPEWNWTLIAHAVGWSIQKQITPACVQLSIYQPRAYHPLGVHRTWRFAGDMLAHMYQRIDRVMTQPTNLLTTGAQCRKCPTRYVCPAYREASMNAIDATSHAYTDSLSAEALAAELDLLEHADQTIQQRKKALTELALFRVRSGEVIPGRAMDRPKGNRRYKKNVDAATLQFLVGRDLSERKLPTPAKLEDMGVPLSVLEAVTERPDGAPRLVKVDVDAMARKSLGVS
jgi:hypothetical protein